MLAPSLNSLGKSFCLVSAKSINEPLAFPEAELFSCVCLPLNLESNSGWNTVGVQYFLSKEDQNSEIIQGKSNFLIESERKATFPLGKHNTILLGKTI